MPLSPLLLEMLHWSDLSKGAPGGCSFAASSVQRLLVRAVKVQGQLFLAEHVVCPTMQAATGQLPDMQTALRVGKSALRTSAFQEEVVTQASPGDAARLHQH